MPICHFSFTSKGPGFKVKTLIEKHTCDDAFTNPRATISSLSQYFQGKVQNNPKFKIKDMRQNLDDQFNLNANPKRMILQKIEGNFLDEYNKLEAYANEIRFE